MANADKKVSDLAPEEYRRLLAEYKRLDSFVGLKQSFPEFINGRK